MAKVIQFKDNTYLYGSIMEKGSNENGNFIKYSDGTLLCYGRVNNNSYSSGIAEIKFPTRLARITNARILLTQVWVSGQTQAYNFFMIGQINSNINGYIYCRDNNGNAIANNIPIDWVLIGEWK